MKLISRKFVIVIFSVVATMFATASHAQALVDKIIVVVNDNVITENDLDRRILRVKFNNQLTEVDQNLRDRILKNMIEELVQLQSARRIGLKVSDAEVNTVLQRFLASKNKTKEQLNQELIDAGLSFSDLIDNLRTSTTLTKLIRIDAVRSVKVSDEEIKTFAKANNIKPKNLQYDVSYLQVKASASSDEEQQQELLEQVTSIKAQSQSAQPTLFQLAELMNTANLDIIRKDLGLNAEENLPSVFAEAVAEMSPGTLSKPIKTSSGVFIVRLNDVRGDIAITEKRKAQHILIKAKSAAEIARAKQTLQRLTKQVDAGVKFENIAQYYSDDANSAAGGGSLGWVKKGQMVPRFEAKLFNMQKGEISEPIVTNFGVHVIKLNDISKVADPQEQMRSVAYNSLMTRKVNQHYPGFLSKLMGEAYIKYL